MKVLAGEKQNLIDIAVTEYGSKWPQGIFAMLEANASLNLDNPVYTGQEIEIVEVDQNDFVWKTYKARKYRVATKGFINYQLIPEGDYMLTPEGQRIEFI